MTNRPYGQRSQLVFVIREGKQILQGYRVVFLLRSFLNFNESQ